MNQIETLILKYEKIQSEMTGSIEATKQNYSKKENKMLQSIPKIVSTFINDLKILNEATVERSSEICSLKYDHHFLKGTGIQECPECGLEFKQISTKRI